MSAPDDWIEAAFAGDRAALARAITAVENETGDAARVVAAAYPRLGRALVVGVTGAPGAGKSTLVGAYVGVLRARGKSVGIVAVDPSSPISGGAVLGDRIRMTAHAADAGVFVRSLAARGALGGLSRSTARVVDVMDAAGKDVIVVETVGTGQSEIAVAGLAAVKVVVTAPGLGDDVQALKAGVLEIADILVVNKADRPLATRDARRLGRLVGLGVGAAPPVLLTTATSGEGIAALADEIEARAAVVEPRTAPRERARRLIAAAAADRVRQVLTSDDEHLDAAREAFLRGDIDLATAIAQALEIARDG